MTAENVCASCGRTGEDVHTSSYGVGLLCRTCFLDQPGHAPRKETKPRGSTDATDSPSLNDAVAPPAPPFLSEDHSGLRQLFQLHAKGAAVPDAVVLPPLWDRPTEYEVRLYDLVRLRFGLLLRDGRREPMMLAVSEVVREVGVLTDGGASKLIHRFESRGIIWNPPPYEMKPLGTGRGTRIFLPGPKPEEVDPLGEYWIEPASDVVPNAVLQTGPIAVEAQHGVTGGTIQPAAESPNELLVSETVSGGIVGVLDREVAAESGAGSVGDVSNAIVAHDGESYAPQPTGKGPSALPLDGTSPERSADERAIIDSLVEAFDARLVENTDAVESPGVES